jgi:hypothetical protein
LPLWEEDVRMRLASVGYGAQSDEEPGMLWEIWYGVREEIRWRRSCVWGAKNVVPSRRLGCSKDEVRCFERSGQVGDMSDNETGDA